MFLKIFPRSVSIEDALKQANEHLENAHKSNNQKEKYQLCKDAKSKLKDAEKIFVTSRVGHASQDEGIAKAYHKHATLLVDLEYHNKAKKSHKKAEDWGFIHAASEQSCSPRPSNITGFIRQSLRPPAAFSVVPGVVTAPYQDVSNLDIAHPIVSSHSPRVTHAITDHILEANVDNAAVPQTIFRQDIVLSLLKYALPESTTRITSTPQLAYYLSLSLPSSVSKEGINETDHELPQAKVTNPEEQERLQTMATELIREFIRDELKTPDVIAEALCLAAVLDKVIFRKLLQAFVDGIENSVLLELHLLDGLAHLIGNAAPECIDADDLVQILELLNVRLKRTHQQSSQHIYRLTQTVSRVLDSMAVSQVKDLKREQLHEPLSASLKELQEGSNPYMVYQAAYAYQALQYIPDDETVLQAALRRTGKIVQGISGVISAVKALDLNGFIQGLQSIHGGLSGTGKAIALTNDAYKNAKELCESGQNLFDSLKESMSLGCKRAWYPALRGLDLLLQEGRLVDFEKLIREAPCRQDPAFQFGVCQRLGEIATNPLLDSNTRQCAISFLEEMYRDDVTEDQQADAKQLIPYTLTQLGHSPDGMVADHISKQFQELGMDRSLFEVDMAIPLLQTSPLLDHVLNKPDVETALRQLKNERLNGRGGDVYISPRAKANQKATEDFDLTSKVQDFLDGSKKVLLLLGDSGVGKSTFNRALEISLWDKREKNGRIPIFIHLPTIDKPEQDLIEKQLRKAGFTENQTRELKATHELILICDGYDESQQTRNLYTSNQLNQPGGWQVQMMISCRTEYAGVDYKDLFQPTDRNSGRSLGLMEEMIIAPFNKDQIQGYIDQYVVLRKPAWEPEDYAQALQQIPNLQDLVKNPFLLKMALEVLPALSDKKNDFTTIRITRVELYDEFVAQWIERSKIRFGEMELNVEDKNNFKRLSDSGFKQHGITYLKEMATAIYNNQGGNPIVKYSEHYDRRTWKGEFFSKMNGNNLLQEAIPLVRNSDQYRFIHKSVLEYGLALAIYDPNMPIENTNPIHEASRRGSASSIQSFEITEPREETAIVVDQPLLESPLGKGSLVKEPSILRFLAERVQQQPVLKDQLHAMIQLSKKDKKARIAAANSITVLVQAGVQFIRADLRGIQIPGADLSYGMFDSARFEGADLRKAKLRNVWLRQANLGGALMGGVQFGELPYLQQDAMVNFCTYSPNGETLAVGLQNGDIGLYDTANWSKVQTLKGHEGGVCSLAYSAQGNRIASGGEDNTVRLWDVATSNCVHILQGHSNWVMSVAYSPKGDRIASGGIDETVRLWDDESGDCVHTLQGHSGYVMSVVYSPEGDRIASGSFDKTARLWDVESTDCAYILQGHSGYVTVAYSPKGDQIASGSADETVRLWDVESGNCVRTLQGHSGQVNSVVYSSKGDQIVSGGDDNMVRLWDVESGNYIHTLQGHSSLVSSVAYSPKGDQIASGSFDSTIRLWDVESDNYVHTSQGHSNWVTSVVYSPKGDQIASGSADKTVRLWDVETGNCVHTLQGHSQAIRSVAYSPEGDQIASGSADKTVRLWDVEAGNCVHTLQGHSHWVTSVVYSPKGDQIASGSADKTVRLWDVGTGNCVRTLQGHIHFVTSVAYSPKGDQIASGSEDKTVRICDIETGECLLLINGFAGAVASISWKNTLDQQYIVTGSDDNSVCHWQIIKEGDGYKVLLSWSSSHGALTVSDASFKDVQGLSTVNWKLLCQRGALNTS